MLINEQQSPNKTSNTVHHHHHHNRIMRPHESDDKTSFQSIYYDNRSTNPFSSFCSSGILLLWCQDLSTMQMSLTIASPFQVFIHQLGNHPLRKRGKRNYGKVSVSKRCFIAYKTRGNHPSGSPGIFNSKLFSCLAKFQ